MSITPEVPAKTLSELVARQIRVAMAVEDIRQSQLARKMGKTEQWLSVRLRGRQAIDVNDLHEFAIALNVNVLDLMPSREDAARAAGREDPRRGVNTPYLRLGETDGPSFTPEPAIRPIGGGRRGATRPPSTPRANKIRPGGARPAVLPRAC